MLNISPYHCVGEHKNTQIFLILDFYEEVPGQMDIFYAHFTETDGYYPNVFLKICLPLFIHSEI